MKYLFSAILVIIFLIFGKAIMNQKEIHHKINVAFPSKKEISSYDPTRIHIDYQYILLESIYSPLINLSGDNGAPISSVAKEHYWKGNELHFVIRENLKTIDGHLITVDDVMISLKRLLVLSQNTHGNFKNLICPHSNLKTIKDDCPGITNDGNVLILKPKAKRDFLVPMLASIDFAIIPKISIDPKTLKIIDYRNTSGPYYVARDEGQGSITLKANSNHFLFDKNMGQEIKLIPTKGMPRNEVINLFNTGKIDHITTIEGFSVSDLKNFDQNKTNFHETIHIKTRVAFITEKGKKKLSLKRRLAFAKALQKSFNDHIQGKEGHRASTQFFVPFGEGGFSKKEEDILKKQMGKIEIDDSGEGIHLAVFKSKSGNLEEYIKISKKHMADLKSEESKGIPAFTKLSDEDMPDYLIVSTDSGFLENISFLSYSMNVGIFGFSKDEGRKWIEDYMNTEDRKERLKKLKKMHLEALSKGFMIPLFSTPYVAASRKPFSPQLSELFANNPLWKIRKN